MKKIDIIGNEEGYFKFILATAVIIFLIYAGFQLGMPYYRYTAFKTDAKELARISLGDTGKTRTELYERAQELKLPLQEKDIEVTRTDKLVRVRASWSETADIIIYQHIFNFKVDVQE